MTAADLLGQEIVDPAAMLLVFAMDGGEGVELDLVPSQQIETLHHPRPGRLLSAIAPVAIVEVLRTIDAEADEETMIAKKTAPFRIQQGAVGLKAILDPLVRWAVLLLQGYGALEPIDAEQGRFTALPGEGHRLAGIGENEVADIGLEQRGGHVRLAVFAIIELVLPHIIAVRAVEVAHRADRLGHDVERCLSLGMSWLGVAVEGHTGFQVRGMSVVGGWLEPGLGALARLRAAGRIGLGRKAFGPGLQ